MSSVNNMLNDRRPITNTKLVSDNVFETAGLEVTELLVRKVMRDKMKLGYRLAKTIPVYNNTERCLVLRQQYALRMLPLLDSGCFTSPPAQYIINIDESWLNGTRFVRRVWAPSGEPATVPDRQVAPRISIIAALDTEGRIWFALTQANTDADIMTTFIRRLMKRLDRERPGW